MNAKAMELKSLVVSKESVAQNTIATAVHGLVSIIDGTGEIMPLSPLGKFDLLGKLLVYLIARRAAVVLGFSTKASGSAEEIAAAMGLNAQRVREYLSRYKGKYFEKLPDGFQVPLPRVMSVCEEITARRK